MKFFTIATAAAAALLTTPTLACKCFSGGNADTARTETCCGQLSGVYSNGDCAASSISERLFNFRSCCGGQCDCDYPHIAEKGANAEEDAGIKTVVVK